MDNLKNNRDEKGEGSKTACSIDYSTLDEASAGDDSKYDSTEDDSSKESSKNSSKATSTKSCKDGSSKESSKASSTKESSKASSTKESSKASSTKSSKNSGTTESSKGSSAEESTKDSGANDEDGNLHPVREDDSQDESIGDSIEEIAEEVADAVEEEEGEAQVDWPAEPHDINSPDSPADESPIHGPPAMALTVHDAASEGIIAPEDVVVFEPEVSVAVQVVHVVSVPAPIEEQQHAPIAAQHHPSSNPTGSVREQPSSANPSVPMREQQRASSVVLKPSSSNPSVSVREQQPSSANPSVSVREQQPSSANPSVSVREQQPSSANPSVSVREQPPSSANPSVSVREQPPSSANPSVSVREHQQSSADPSVSVSEQQPSSADISVPVREQQQPSSADPSGPVREQQPSLANPSVPGRKQQLVSSVAQHQSSANQGVVQVTQHAGPNKVPHASAANFTLPGREQRPSSANPSVPPREQQLASNVPLQPSSANPTVPVRDEQQSTPKPAVHTREQQRASNVAQPTSSVNPSVPEGELRQVTNVPRQPSADSLLEHQTTNPQPGTLETQPTSFIDSVCQVREHAGVDRAPNVRSEIDEGVSGHLCGAVAVGEETLPAVTREEENMTVHNLASEAVSRGTPALDQSELPRFPAEASPEGRPLRMRNALLGAQRSLLSSAFPGSGHGRNVSSVPLRLPTLPRPLAPEPGPVQLVGFSVMGHPFLVTTPPLIYDGTPLREQTSSPGRGTEDHEASAPGTDGTTVLAAAVLCGSVAIFLLTVARYLNWR